MYILYAHNILIWPPQKKNIMKLLSISNLYENIFYNYYKSKFKWKLENFLNHIIFKLNLNYLKMFLERVWKQSSSNLFLFILFDLLFYFWFNFVPLSANGYKIKNKRNG